MSMHVLNWERDHGILVADGHRCWYTIRKTGRKLVAWKHREGHTSIPIAEHHDLEDLQGQVAQLDAPKGRRRT